MLKDKPNSKLILHETRKKRILVKPTQYEIVSCSDFDGKISVNDGNEKPPFHSMNFLFPIGTMW